MRWHLRSADEERVSSLAAEADLPLVVARLLVARGIANGEEAQRFLHPSLEHLHSPHLMLGMDKAAERLRRAIANREQVLIYGDYDVDGTTAVVILKTAIELCGGSADFHVPHRIREGYGMKDDVIERAAAAGVSLIVSVDTGIRAFAAAETAQRAGVDLIVTDHHLPEGHGVPPALAVLNPNQAGCAYPCKALCGAGVAFKLAQLLLEETGRARLLPSFLKMVAIATIADAVPLIGENRVFAKLGLDGLRHPVNVGLKALLEVSALSAKKLSASDVGFRIAPRLNAAGRMDVAQDVVDLFSVKDTERAREIAARLNQLNSDRQQEEKRIFEAVEERLASAPDVRDTYCLVVDGDQWHRGVIGIAATRVVERYGRPTLVLSREDGEAYGSGRSIPAFHLLDALESCRDMFTRFGGHAHAVGFSLPCDRVPALRAALDTYARERLTPADFERVLEYDGELPLNEVTPALYECLQRLEPFGMSNPEPVFAARGARVAFPPKILKEKHVKMRLIGAPHPEGGPPLSLPVEPAPSAAEGERQGGAVPNSSRNGRGIDALGWRMAERVQQASILAGDLVDVAFTLDLNDHPEFGGLELRLEDIVKSAHAQSATGATR
ncbi:MAG: single-stranded-DNA-specific exonuclease RecJ [Acidobacteriia bacterium]|nr:single-stranded-DNA-specific exonuclease RecJ [Terriglobia bacterium]